MGNCWKKKQLDEAAHFLGDEKYFRIKDRSIRNDGPLKCGINSSETTPLQDKVTDQEFQTRLEDKEIGSPSLDETCLQLIRELNLGPKLNSVRAELDKVNRNELKKLTDDRDRFTMYFDVKTDDKKEKYHVTASTLRSHLSPLAYKLANTMISEADELKMTSSYERFMTIFRGKVDDVFYIVNYTLYKQIMFFSKKDMLYLKAFKQFDNGDVAEIAVSISHPEFPENPKFERMALIECLAYIAKTDTGCEATTINKMYPKISAGATILKPLFANSYRNYYKALDEYLLGIRANEGEMTNKFVNFRSQISK